MGVDEAGWTIADAYYLRVEARLLSLSEFPRRGTPRDELQPGIRTVPFERRLVVFYEVEGDTVTVRRVINGARETRGLLN